MALVFVASTAGLKGYPYVAAYCAAKHGVVGLARSLALELAGRFAEAVSAGAEATDRFAALGLAQEVPMLRQRTALARLRPASNASDPRVFAHPRHWAGFVMFGE